MKTVKYILVVTSPRMQVFETKRPSSSWINIPLYINAHEVGRKKKIVLTNIFELA
jgi:hypothetical protein